MAQVRVVLKSVWDDKAIKNAQKSLEGISKGITNTFKAIGVAAVAATAAFAKLSADSIKAASSLQESTNAVNVAFGKSADAILAIGENSAQSLGLARTEFNQAAVRFSAFADRIVEGGGTTAEFIQTITQRAADFASVFNIDVAEALQVFQSGLSGEAEPLKRFGINLLESEVKAYALRAGIISVGEAMTETQKVQARYGLLLESTAKTAGDFANTSDSLANRQRILKATFTDIQAEIGAAMLPALEKLVGVVVDDLLPIFKDLGERVGPAVADILEFIAEVFEEAFTEGTDLNKSLDELADSFDLLFSAITNGQRDAKGFSDFLANLVYIIEFIVTSLASLIAGFQGFGIAIEALKRGDLETVFKFLTTDTIEFIEAVNGASDAVNGLNDIDLSQFRSQLGDTRVDGERLVHNARQLALAMKGIFIPNFVPPAEPSGGGGGGGGGGTGARSGPSAFEQVQKIVKDAQKKLQAAQERYSKAIASANKAYSEAVRDAEKTYANALSDATKDRDKGLADATLNHARNIANIQRDFANKQAEIIQRSIDRLRDAYQSAVRTNVADLFGSDAVGKSIDKLITGLRDRLTASRTLVQNAALLASGGFSQTFIEQIVGAGLETGNELAKAILEATPETQKELQGLFGALETESETGMDSLAQTIFEKTGLATTELKKLFAQTQTDLVEALKQAEIDYATSQANVLASFDEAMARAMANRDEAFASASERLNEALSSARDTYLETLRDIQEAFDEQIKALEGKLGGLANTVKSFRALLASLMAGNLPSNLAGLLSGRTGGLTTGADIITGAPIEVVKGLDVAAKAVNGATGLLIDSATDVGNTLAYLDARIANALKYANNISFSNEAAAASARATAAEFIAQRQALAAAGESAVGTVININVKTDSTQSLAMVGRTLGNTITKYVTTGGEVLVSSK